MPFAKREGYLARAVRPGNFSAVTGACQMIRRDVFERVGGYNEEFAAGFNDADFCLWIRVLMDMLSGIQFKIIMSFLTILNVQS